MAGPIDLKGTVTIIDRATGALKSIKSSLGSVADAAGKIKTPAAFNGDLKRAAADLERVRRAAADRLAPYRAAVRAEQVERLSGAVAEYGAVAGTAVSAGFGLAKSLADSGQGMLRLRRNMDAAGVSVDDINEAEKKSWELTSKYRNMSATEIMAIINDGRTIFGNQRTATEHAEPFIGAGAFLKMYEGGKHSHASGEIASELFAAMKSGEISSKISPEDLQTHVDALTAMKVVFGDQVKIREYLQAQRLAGTSFLASGDDYRYGVFPALVQEYGGQAGVMMQTLATKVLADTGNRKYAIAAQQQFGLRGEDGNWKDQETFARNKLEWIASTVIPSLEKAGVNVKDNVQLMKVLGKMFPDRNASKDMAELILQLTRLKKVDELRKVVRDRHAREKLLPGDWDYEVEGFEKRLENIRTSLGATLTPTMGAGLQMLNSALGGISEYLKDHSTFATVAAAVAVLGTSAGGAAIGLGTLAAALAFMPGAAGAAARLGASAMLAWRGLRMLSTVGIVLGAGAVVADNWDAITARLESLGIKAKAATDHLKELATALGKGDAKGVGEAGKGLFEAWADSVRGTYRRSQEHLEEHRRQQETDSTNPGSAPPPRTIWDVFRELFGISSAKADELPGGMGGDGGGPAGELGAALAEVASTILNGGIEMQGAMTETSGGIRSSGNEVVASLQQVAAAIQNAAAQMASAASSVGRATLNTGRSMGAATP